MKVSTRNPMQDCGEVNTLLEAHIQQVEMRVSALLQLKRHLVDLREKCSGSRSVEACGILQGWAIAMVKVPRTVKHLGK